MTAGLKGLAGTFCLLIVACGGGADDAEVPPATPPAAATSPTPAALSLADIAGRWTVQVMPENADTTLLTYEMQAAPEGQDWQLIFPGRTEPVMSQVVSVAGDSVVLRAGPFESNLQAGVMVTTESVMRLQNGSLVGRTTARYQTSGADSVVVLRQRGTRAQ